MGSSLHLKLHRLHLKTGQKWSSDPDGLHFVFIIQGSGTYTLGTDSQPLEEADILILSGAAGGHIRPSNGRSQFCFDTFSLSVESLFPLLATNEISLLQPLTEQLKGRRVLRAGSPISLECHGLLASTPADFNLNHRAQLLRVAATVLNSDFQAVRKTFGTQNQVDKNAAQALNGLSAGQLLALSVSQLAAKLRCSRRQVNRLFHIHFNGSVASLKMELRLLRATSLLRDPAAKVIDVATDCGFNHLGFFNSCFRKRFGRSPTEWRKETNPTPCECQARLGPDPQARSGSRSPSAQPLLCPATPGSRFNQEQCAVLGLLKSQAAPQPCQLAAGPDVKASVTFQPAPNKSSLRLQVRTQP